MNRRWAPAFTIVELLIVIVVIGVLASISIIAYTGVQKQSANAAMQSDLDQATSEMQRLATKNSGSYPTTLPSSVKTSPGVTLKLASSGTYNYYTPLNEVQNGELMSQICQDLIAEGAGKGVDQGGTTQDYISDCGNWNQGSMQLTAWTTKKFTTPVTAETLLSYADTFTVASNQSYNKAQEAVVKNFYHELVKRQAKQGGHYPITSFWDYWANPQSGGVAFQALPTPQQRPTYCIQATYAKYSDLIWHVTEENKITPGAC